MIHQLNLDMKAFFTIKMVQGGQPGKAVVIRRSTMQPFRL
jgi:hypothetical protein